MSMVMICFFAVDGRQHGAEDFTVVYVFSKDRSVYRSNAGKVRRPCWTVSISNQSAQSGSTSNFRFYFGIGKSEVSSRKLNGIRQWVEALRDK